MAVFPQSSSSSNYLRKISNEPPKKFENLKPIKNEFLNRKMSLLLNVEMP